jgi:broad specificity phosphatase PhoE
MSLVPNLNLDDYELPMKVCFVRHAESIFNAQGKSEKDCDLTEKGKQQAAHLQGEYDVVICSIMNRTRQTLALSQIKAGQVIYTDLCREKRTDICDFLPHEDETQVETMGELLQRIQRFIYFLKSQVSPYQSVLVVSHGDFIHTIGNAKQPYPMNAEVQVYTI